MTERLRHQGRLAEEKERSRRIRIRAESLRNSLREHLDPFDEIAKLQGEVIAEEAIQLAQVLEELRACLALISQIERTLGTGPRE